MTVLFVTHDIDEAVYLGERVLVLSASPTVVREEVVVELPVESDQLTTRADALFVTLHSRIYEVVREVQKGAEKR
ncbi:hypothetical protein [Streptomyces sp. NPDC050738]|uniref:hypothetical protein n=1 Tax=Streptomyces sp. NPDC050738 TaxID=3154744 RepID=UPI00341E5E00